MSLACSLLFTLPAGPSARAAGPPSYPGPLPGPAQLAGEAHSLRARNAALEVSWDWASPGLRIRSLRDQLSGQSLALKGELFQIVLAGGHRYPASALVPVGAPLFSQLAPQPRASRLAARVPGRQVELTLRSPDGKLNVVWRALLRDDANHLRQEFSVTPAAADCVIEELLWLDEALPGAACAGTVDGSPLVAGNFFFGLEDPHALSSTGKSLQELGSWSPADLEVGKFRRKSWPLAPAWLASGTNEILFQYQRGAHRLDVVRVALTENGREIARDEHPGRTGNANVQNVYSLPLARLNPAARYELVAEIGTDPHLQLPPASPVQSFGHVSLRREDRRLSFHLRRDTPLRVGQTLTTSLVLGVAPAGQMRRAFLCYLERERAHPYRPFLHYNSWYDISPWHFPPEGWDPYALNETNSLDAIRSFGERLIRPYGVAMDSMVFDEGWDDIDSLWEFHRGFPNGFTPHAALCRQYGTSLGVWLSPRGGGVKAKEHRLAYGALQGYETNTAGFSLAGPKYYDAFKSVCLRMIRQYGVNHFKLDGIAQGSLAPGRAASGAGAAFTLDTDALRRLMLELRQESPELYINFTTGSWPSPFWLRYADSLWRGGRDTGLRGKGSRQQQGLTYRDSETFKNVVQAGPLYPLNSLMSGGITYSRHGHPANPTYNSAGLQDDIRSYFGSGTGLQELYIQPSRLTTNDWSVLAEAARWARANADVLVDTHWLGGNPASSEVYGWASWSPRKGILTLRNPDDQPHEFALDVGVAFELPAGAPTKYTLHSPWTEDAAKPTLLAQAGKPLPLTLQPFEVLVLEAVASTKPSP